jgi:hypothetical protein
LLRGSDKYRNGIRDELLGRRVLTLSALSKALGKIVGDENVQLGHVFENTVPPDRRRCPSR